MTDKINFVERYYFNQQHPFEKLYFFYANFLSARQYIFYEVGMQTWNLSVLQKSQNEFGP